MEIKNVKINKIFENTITVIKNKFHSVEKVVYIEMDLDETNMLFSICLMENKWVPGIIKHFKTSYDKRCAHCHRRLVGKKCAGFEDGLDEVFNIVMNHPAVRLKKIF